LSVVKSLLENFKGFKLKSKKKSSLAAIFERKRENMVSFLMENFVGN